MQTKSPPRLAAEALAFFLDFDGTLVPFDKPDETVPLVDDGLRSLLTELRNRADGALAIVSGRSIEVIDNLFEPLRLAAAGEHGAEWRFTPHATREQLVPPPGLVTAHAACEQFANLTLGVRFERKALSMVLHFHRHPELREAAAKAAESGCLPGSGVRVMHARGMVEVKPEEASKGAAINRFMQAFPFAGRKPVFIGDDITDEDGFLAVNALDGISIKVGPGNSHARYRLPDEDAVRDWLEQLLD